MGKNKIKSKELYFCSIPVIMALIFRTEKDLAARIDIHSEVFIAVSAIFNLVLQVLLVILIVGTIRYFIDKYRGGINK